MKNFLFIASHLGSDWDKFVPVLNANPRVQITPSDYDYSSPLDILPNFRVPHKLGDNPKAIYGDITLFNHSFFGRDLYPLCKFVYLIRPARTSLAEMLSKPKTEFTPLSAYRYYSFRLRRLCEMAKYTPGALLLTWNDLQDKRGMDLLENYLGLVAPVTIPDGVFVERPVDIVPQDLAIQGDDCYERYLYYLRKKLVSTRPV